MAELFNHNRLVMLYNDLFVIVSHC